MLCAKLPQNVSKNRYRDISPCTSVSVGSLALPLPHLLFPPFEIFSFFPSQLFSLFLYVQFYPLLLSFCLLL